MKSTRPDTKKHSSGTRDSAASRDGAQSLYRAITILRSVADHEEDGARMSQIAKATSLPTTTAHRILSVLVKEGFIEYDPQSKHYHLGIEFVSLGSKAQKFMIRHKCRSALENIARQTEETCYLIIRSGNDAICVDRVLGTFPIQVLTFEIGQRRALGIGGGSAAILSNLSEKERDRIIRANAPRYEKYNSRTAEDVFEIVKQAREAGYAMSVKNVTEGTVGVGVPVFDAKGEVIAAISVSGIERRMGQQRIAAIVDFINSEIAALDY